MKAQRIFSFAGLGLLLATVASAAPLHPLCPAQQGNQGKSRVVGDRVVCLTDFEVAWRYELVSVPLAGGAWTRLSPPLGDDRDVILFEGSPDGQRVAFTADARRWRAFELYTVPIAGGAAVLLNRALLPDHVVDTFAWSSDSGRLVWRQGRNAVNLWGLWSAPATSLFGALEISQAMTLGGAVQQGFTAVGDHAHFLADAVVDERYERWVAKLTAQDVRPAAIFADGFESRGTGAWR